MDPTSDRIEELLDLWEEGAERGQPPTLEDLCRDAPELRDEVARRISVLRAMDLKFHGTEETTLADRFPSRIQAIADFDELRFHARGGLGIVCTAIEKKVHRTVAVKFLRSDIIADLESQQQFALEAEITGRLEHPGVVPLYGIGHDSRGSPFYYMRYIDGETLDHAISSFHQAYGPLDFDRPQDLGFRSLLLHFVSLCKTIAYAHNRGIVHRDVKPQNVMLGRYGETIVVDWGLAVAVDRDEKFRIPGEGTLRLSLGGSSGSSSGRGTGTPAYMSPEQMAGLEATPASDIYSLGATLYKLFTGSPPFSGGSAHEVRRQVMEGKFPLPLERQPRGSRALQAIVLKALAHKSKDRYATALELAQDIENYLADVPVAALADTWHERVARWTRNHWHITQIGVALLTIAAILSWISSAWLGTMARQQKLARRQTEILRNTAEEARRENLRSSAGFLARSIAYEIDLRWRILESESNSEQLRQQLTSINREPSNRESWKILQSWLEKRFIVHTNSVKSVSWFINAANGTQVARVPEAASIGQNFSHRDYFHGQGIDLDPQAVVGKSIPPMVIPVHMSTVYESTITHTLMVAFSVPIWDGPPEVIDRKPLGVLSMAVELGAFPLGEDGILADTRRDSLGKSAGLILHHEKLGARSTHDLPPRLSPETVELAKSIRNAASLAGDTMANSRGSLREEFQDPVTGESVLAAMEPVIIRGRDKSIADSGWIVLVTEHHESP
jgi:eukaryotic-like serine/threonine-protein kinase